MGNDLNHYQKSIRRKLNKVKKGFDSDDNLDIMSIGDVEKFNINYPENITSVDPSSLCSMTVGIALFNNMGITKIIVPDFFSVRHNAKLIANSIRANFKFGEEKERFLVDSEIKQDRINRNIVDKKIRLFRRLSSHFEFLSIDNYPKELDDSLYMSINEDYCCNNEVLNDVYTKTANSINEINKHKR